MSANPTTARKLGYQDYLAFPDDGLRHEIIDGVHYVTASPFTYHQTLSRRIQFQLYTQIELRGLGEVFDAPTCLQLSEVDIVEPDLVIVLRDNHTIIQRAKIDGIPDLIVEILSPSTAARDRGVKQEIFRRAGVPEYWIVDPDEHVVDQFVLRSERYELLGKQQQRIEFQGISGVAVDLSQVW